MSTLPFVPFVSVKGVASWRQELRFALDLAGYSQVAISLSVSDLTLNTPATKLTVRVRHATRDRAYEFVPLAGATADWPTVGGEVTQIVVSSEFARYLLLEAFTDDGTADFDLEAAAVPKT